MGELQMVMFEWWRDMDWANGPVNFFRICLKSTEDLFFLVAVNNICGLVSES